jgi:hypothetical protein
MLRKLSIITEIGQVNKLIKNIYKNISSGFSLINKYATIASTTNVIKKVKIRLRKIIFSS